MVTSSLRILVDFLRGSLYLYDGGTFIRSSPTKSPSSGGGAEAFTSTDIPPISSTYPFLIIIIVVAAVALAFLFGLIAYCCCCTPLIVPLDKKKKKKKKGEQEDPSPYTVHSYRGYVDSDDEDAYVIDTPTGEVKKRDEDIKKMMKEGSSLNAPYKVYGPRGYVEELRPVAYVKKMSSNNFQPTDPRATSTLSPSEGSIEDFSATRFMQQQSPGAASYSTVASSHHSTPSNISFVELAKEQYLQLQEVSSEASVSSNTDMSSSKSISFIDQAKDRLRHYKSSSGDSHSSSSASTHSSSTASVSSSSSFVEQAKAKVKQYKQTREMLSGEYNNAVRVQIDSSQSTPLVEEESIICSEDQRDSSVDDSRSSTTSYVEQAKASGMLLYRQQVMMSSSSSSSSGNHPHPSLTASLKSSSVNAYNVSAVSSDHSNLSSASAMQVKHSESINRSSNRPQLHPGPASKSSSSSAIHDGGAVVAQSRARYQALRKDAEKRLSRESNKSSDMVTLNTRDSSTSDNLHSDSDIFVLSNSTVTVKSSTNSSSRSFGIYQSHTSSNSSTSSSNSETRLEVSSSSEEVLAYGSHYSSMDADLSRSDGSYLDRI